MSNKVETFQKERTAYNEILAKYSTPDMKRFLGVDTTTYLDGA
ncbi:MAG: carboxymuconolactone decarboxylase family protein, partial [Alphaproteobacteria bacterium]|nr:carboxymuconolactone decarboxylase family protein [Alphaproteobacteria bacterium]